MRRDEIEAKLVSIDVSLARQVSILEEHIRRTIVAEKRIEMLQLELDSIKTHVSMVSGALRLVGLVGVVSGIVVAGLAVIKSVF
jgi:hypothetical protein